VANRMHRILVAVKDLGARDFPAAKKAAQLARVLNAELCLFHAITEPLYVETLLLTKHPIAHFEEQTKEKARRRLERIANSLRGESRQPLQITTETAWDYPAHDAITRAAIRLEADLVVVECERSTHVLPWFLRFTDWELLRNCPFPVLLIKNRKPYHRSPVLAAIDPTHAFAKPADLDDEILASASNLARALDGDVHAVHAYNPVPGMSPAELASADSLARAEEAAMAAAHASVDPLLDALGMPPTKRHIVEGFAVDVIEDVTRQTGAQIVTMGAVSRSGLKRLLIGNTAEQMLDRMTADVLIIKPRGFRSPASNLPRGPQIIVSPALSAAVAAIS